MRPLAWAKDVLGLHSEAETSETERFFECRDCGQTVPNRDARCPECDSTNIAAYEL